MDPITAGTRVLVEKGCKALGITKNMIAQVREVTPLGPEYAHAVKVVVVFLNGMHSHASRTKTLYARHPNRLGDERIGLNSGRPEHRVEVVRCRSQG